MAFLLDRLSLASAIAGAGGKPTQLFQRLWQKTCAKIEEQENLQDQVIADLAGVVSDLSDVVDDLAAQLILIQAAQAAAEAADDKAVAAARESARINSYPAPTNVLTAADVGSDCTITIANHSRIYPVQGSIDVADVAITGGTLTGLAFGTEFYVYYDDETLADTTPTFVSTATAATAQVGAAAGRHFVGVITTPADGAGDTGGSGGTPPGGGGGNPLP